MYLSLFRVKLKRLCQSLWAPDWEMKSMSLKLDIFSDKIRCFPHLTTVYFIYYSFALLFCYKPNIDWLLDMHIKSINIQSLRIILVIGYRSHHVANRKAFLSTLPHTHSQRHLVTLISLHMPAIRCQ